MKTLASFVIALTLVCVTAVPARTQQEFPTVVLPPGFRIEKVVDGLTFPTAVAWDQFGAMYVSEAGGAFLEEPAPSRILLVEPGRAREVINLENFGVMDSVAGITIYNDALYFTHRAVDRTGAVSRLTRDGRVTLLFSGVIDSQAEHQLNDIKPGPGGLLYVASGPATNSGVVGLDNAPFVLRSPDLRATPCRDYVLNGVNFETPNFRTPDPSDVTRTGAFVPFGTETTPGQVIRGTNRCGGSILAFDPFAPDPGATVRPIADGFRNIIGLAISPITGEAFAAVNGFDVRGSRPVNDTHDATYRIRAGQWYGWPDFSAQLLPVTERKFDSPDSLQAPQFIGGQPVGRDLRFLINHEASGLTPPDRSLVAGLHEINSSPSLLDVAPASWGEFAGQVFVAEWGDLAPQTSPLRDGFAGFQISRIDPATGSAVPFVRNRMRGPASAQSAQGQGIERPYDIKFGPDGAMYIIDYGIARVNPTRPPEQGPYEFVPFTGVVWRVTRTP